MWETIRVGTFTDKERGTGATVFLFDDGATASYHTFGFAVGEKELAPCEPEHIVQRIHALVFTGGSALGLDAVSGVVRFLEEKGVGFPTLYKHVPIVPAAVIFDLSVSDHNARPSPEDLYKACTNAKPLPPPSGCFGAGTGATVGKICGIDFATKSGQGWAQVTVDECELAAFCVMNAFGDVIEPTTGKIVAGARSPENPKKFLDTSKAIISGKKPFSAFDSSNTVLIGIFTDAKLDKLQAKMLAKAGGAALARVVKPVHTLYDGDICFAVSVGEKEMPLIKLMTTAQELVAEAAIDAVKSAESLFGLPTAKDIENA